MLWDVCVCVCACSCRAVWSFTEVCCPFLPVQECAVVSSFAAQSLQDMLSPLAQVDYLEVVNRGYVRVYFKADRGGGVSLSWGEVLPCCGLHVFLSPYGRRPPL